MRSLAASLCVFFAAALFCLPANADLLSLYTFDNTAANSVSTAPDGTLLGGATYTTGKIGNAVSLDGIDDCVDTTTSGYPNTNGILSGSISFWINTTDTKKAHIIAACNTNDSLNFDLATNAKHNTAEVGNFFLYLCNSTGSGSYSVDMSSANQTWRDGAWHQVVLTWTVTTGSSGTGTAQFYIDGTPVSTDIGYNSCTSSSVFSTWENPVRIGVNGRTAAGDIKDNMFLDGALDDVGVWNDLLSDAEAAAIYNLACDTTLNYGTTDANTLFDIFASQGSGQTSDGQTWRYVTGLTGAAGSVLNHNTVILGDGVGVQMVPEPNTTILLGMAGVAGLVICGWRKRK